MDKYFTVTICVSGPYRDDFTQEDIFADISLDSKARYKREDVYAMIKELEMIYARMDKNYKHVDG